MARSSLTIQQIEDFYAEYDPESAKLPINMREVPAYIAYVLLNEPQTVHYAYAMEQLFLHRHAHLSLVRPKLHHAIKFLESKKLIYLAAPPEGFSRKIRLIYLNTTADSQGWKTMNRLSEFWRMAHEVGHERN